ncbi:sensor histidine kinase [Devosia sp. A449]
MSRSARTLIGIALPILTIAIFALLLAFSLMRLSNIERDMRIEATQNMVWVVSRSHVASLQLSEAAARRSLGEIDQETLQLRHQLFLSRVSLLNDGPQRRKMQALGFGPVLDAFQLRLPELAALLDTLQPGAMAELRAIDGLLDPYDAMLTQAANKAMVAEWDDLGGKLDTSRHQLWQIIISVIGISLAGAVLSIHFLLTISDARRRARLLDKERAFSELLIGSSGEGIVAVDLERRCTVWNAAAEQLFRLPAGKTIGCTLSAVSGFFQVERINQAMDLALAGTAMVLSDQPFFPPGRDAPLYLDLRCFSLRDGERIIGAILLVSDETERRAAQRQTAEHRDQLEHLVQARTRELDAALERERTTADLYRHFGTMISHQFRTPLAIVDSALQRLMRRSDKLSAAEVLDRGGKARQAIARLIRLVESTLDAARLDAGQIEIRSEACDLGQVAAEVCARQHEATPRRKILLDAGPSPTMARCDPVHVENILVNLLTNAIKYSAPDSPISVTVRGDGQAVQCAVSNRGALACPDEREALFERYFRGQNAEGRPGIGIGLYMARSLARMQGGDVQLADHADDQVSFVLTLPQVSDLAEPTPLRLGEPA